MAVKILAKKEKLGILPQATWGTPVADAGAFRLCQWIDAGSPNPNPDVQIDQFNVTSQNGIHYESERFFVDATSGLPTIPFSGTCEKATMAMFLVGALQAVSEAVGTPFEKTITCGGLTAPIDFAAGGGELHTVALQQGGGDDSVILSDAIIGNLNIVWDLNARGITRLVNMNGTWVGRLLEYEQTVTDGNWVNDTIVQTGFFNNTDTWTTNFSGALLTIGGVDYSAECIRRFELQINNNVTSNCKTTGGKAAQYDLAPEYKVILSLDYNATTEKILKDFAEGVTATMNWSNDSADAGTDGKWSMTFPLFRLMSPPKVYRGDFVGVECEFRCYSLAAATPITMYYADAVDYGY